VVGRVLAGCEGTNGSWIVKTVELWYPYIYLSSNVLPSNHQAQFITRAHLDWFDRPGKTGGEDASDVEASTSRGRTRLKGSLSIIWPHGLRKNRRKHQKGDATLAFTLMDEYHVAKPRGGGSLAE